MVLITGVKGFIGHHLYDYLMDEGYDVKGIDDCSGLGWEDREVPHLHCDITKDPAPFIQKCWRSKLARVNMWIELLLSLRGTETAT